jgi:hypothetical protein
VVRRDKAHKEEGDKKRKTGLPLVFSGPVAVFSLYGVRVPRI